MKKLIFALTILSTTVFANEQTNTNQDNIKKIEQEQQARQKKVFQEGIDFANKTKEEVVNKEEFKDGEAFAKEMCKQYPIQCNVKK